MVYIAMMDQSGAGNNDTDVVTLVSTDLGTTFDGAISVNHDPAFPNQCGSSGTGLGGIATIDQPKATYDYTTSPPTLWVAYRWRACDACTYGACIRRGVVDKTATPATVHWLGPATNVEGLGTAAAFPGIGGVRVAAGDGVVTVAYSSSAFLFRCPSNSTAAIDWGSVDSFDNGTTWVDNAKIFDSGDYHWCVANGTVDMDFGIEIARAPGGLLYAVIPSGGPDTDHDAKNFVRLFKSPAAGIKGYQNSFSTQRSWFEWCKDTPTSNVPGGPTTNWINVEKDGKCAVPAFTGTGPSVAMPTISADGLGRVAVAYYETDATDTLIRVMFQGNVNPQDPNVDFQTTPLTGFYALPDSFGRPLGDYMSIAIKPNRDQTPLFQPGCTDANDFFPFWVQSSSPRPSRAACSTGSDCPSTEICSGGTCVGAAEVAVTGVTLTP